MVSRKLLALILLLGSGVLYAEQADSLDVPVKTFWEATADEYNLAQALPADQSAISKADVLAFIEAERVYGYPDPLPFSYPNNPSIVNSYRSGYDYAGLGNEPFTLRKEAFPLPATMHSDWLHLGYMSQFHYPLQQGSIVHTRHLPYEKPVSLSRLQGSLGDYDSRYAVVSFAKGQLIGINGLSGQFDYSLYNGWWVDMPSGGSSNRQYLAYRHKELFWSVEMGNYVKESGSYELHPAYWHLGNYRLKNKHAQIIGSFQNPWINLNIASFNDRNTATSFSEAWQSKSQHFSADRTLNLGDAVVFIRHEYRDLRRNYQPTLSENKFDYENLSTVELSSPYFADSNLVLEMLDFDELHVSGSLNRRFGIVGFGMFARQNFGIHNPAIRISSPLDGSLMDAVDVYSPAETAITSSLNFKALILEASLGRKEIKQHSPGYDYTANPNILRLSSAFEIRLREYSLKINSAWNYQEFNPYLMAAPEFSFASHQSITRHLSHDNLLEAGFSIYGHSDYYTQNIVSPVLIEASTMLDARATVRISKLFDFSVSAKNLLSTSLYGLNPIPLSLHAGVRWYFIN